MCFLLFFRVVKKCVINVLNLVLERLGGGLSRFSTVMYRLISRNQSFPNRICVTEEFCFISPFPPPSLVLHPLCELRACAIGISHAGPGTRALFIQSGGLTTWFAFLNGTEVPIQFDVRPIWSVLVNGRSAFPSSKVSYVSAAWGRGRIDVFGIFLFVGPPNTRFTLRSFANTPSPLPPSVLSARGPGREPPMYGCKRASCGVFGESFPQRQPVRGHKGIICVRIHKVNRCLKGVSLISRTP